MGHYPYGFIVVDFEFPFHFVNRYAGLGCRHPENQHEPFQQFGPCLMENRARSQGHLMLAGRTFVQPSGGYLPIALTLAASGTLKSVRPPGLEQPFNTVFFRSEFLLKNEPAHLLMVWFPVLVPHDRLL